MKLVVNNAPQPEPPAQLTERELRLECQARLVQAAKQSPLRALIVLDLGGEWLTLTAGLNRQQASLLAALGKIDALKHLTD